MSKGGTSIFDVVSSIFDFIGDVSNIKYDKENREKNKKYGKKVIISCCLALVILPLCFYLTSKAFFITRLSFSGLGGLVPIIWSLLFLFVVVVGDLYALFYLIIFPIIYWFAQLTISRNSITWISLIVLIVSFSALGFLAYAYFSGLIVL